MKNIIENVIKKKKLQINEFQNYTNEIAKIISHTPRKQKGKLVIVTSMNPTPEGEGKTTTAIGLVDGLNKIKVKAIGALREPSLGPVFGLKGTGSGSNKAKLLPFDKINLHFTGDLHAITTANNLISAIIENEIYHNSELKIDPERILWKRCLDMNDRSLREVVLNIDNTKVSTAFNITAASDLMALFCLAKNIEDFTTRLNKTIVAYSKDAKPITIADLQLAKAIEAILQDAFYPNLVRTLENNPVLVHGGPFANIAHGCSSISSINLGLDLADIVVTEAGFGSDLGLEKFMNITCAEGNFSPALIVLTISLKSIIYNGNNQNALSEIEQVIKGFQNVKHHIEHCKKYNTNLIVVINRRTDDDRDSLEFLIKLLQKEKVAYSISDAWAYGSSGSKELAKKVVQLIKEPTNWNPLYFRNESFSEKIQKICKQVYGAKGIEFSPTANRKLDMYQEYLDKYYVCMAKNPYSLTCDPTQLGKPVDFVTTIEDIEINHVAKFIIPITSVVYRMPGLPKKPIAKNFVMK